MKKLLTILLLFLSLVGESQILNVSLIADPAPAGITITGVFTPFTNVAGTPPTAQTISISATGLTSNLVFTPTTTDVEASKDGTTWTGSVSFTPSGGSVSSSLVYLRTKAATSAGSFSGFLQGVATPASTTNTAYSGTVSAPIVKDSIRVQMDTTVAFNVAGWTHLLGDPSLSVLTATGGNNNNITVSTVSTDFFHWQPFGACTGPNTGITTSTVPNYAPSVMKECHFNANATFNLIYPQYTVSGLKPNTQYDVQIFAALNCTFGLSSNGEYRVGGATVSTVQTLVSLCNTNTVLSFPLVQSDGSGNINIYFNLVSGQQVAALNAFIIKEH